MLRLMGFYEVAVDKDGRPVPMARYGAGAEALAP